MTYQTLERITLGNGGFLLVVFQDLLHLLRHPNFKMKNSCKAILCLITNQNFCQNSMFYKINLCTIGISSGINITKVYKLIMKRRGN